MAWSSFTATPSSREVEERPNRIGIDTGAYQSGVLTALAVEDEARWYLSTAGSPAPAWAGDEAVPREGR